MKENLYIDQSYMLFLIQVLLPRTEKSPKEHLFGPPQNPPDPNVDTSPTHIEGMLCIVELLINF